MLNDTTRFEVESRHLTGATDENQEKSYSG
jgi:hypothetical protein